MPLSREPRGERSRNQGQQEASLVRAAQSNKEEEASPRDKWATHAKRRQGMPSRDRQALEKAVLRGSTKFSKPCRVIGYVQPGGGEAVGNKEPEGDLEGR